MESGSPPERKPPRGFATPGAQSAARRYSLFVGLAFVAFAVFAFVSTRLSDDGGQGGSLGLDPGTPLPPFAVPEAQSDLQGDANVFQDDCETSANPCPESEQRTPACAVEGTDVIRICDLFDRPLVVSFWFTRGGECLPSQDAVDELASRYGDRVNFLSLNVRDDREEVRRIIDERDWSLPVGYDADGAVSGLYRVGGCPTVALAYPGGILAETAIGEDNVTVEALGERVDELVAESRRRAEASR
jgi:hypothetical protein